MGAVSRFPPSVKVLSDHLARIEAKLDLALRELKSMATLQDVQNAVAAEQTVINGVTTLLQQLSQQLKDALASEDPAAIQGLIDQINQNANALANAVAANTPAAGGAGVGPPATGPQENPPAPATA